MPSDGWLALSEVPAPPTLSSPRALQALSLQPQGEAPVEADGAACSATLNQSEAGPQGIHCSWARGEMGVPTRFTGSRGPGLSGGRAS